MWAFSAAPPNQLIYGADHLLFCCRAFWDWHQSSLSGKIEYFWWVVPGGVYVCLCVYVSVFVSVVRTGWVCCCWVYRGFGALVGMR